MNGRPERHPASESLTDPTPPRVCPAHCIRRKALTGSVSGERIPEGPDHAIGAPIGALVPGVVWDSLVHRCHRGERIPEGATRRLASVPRGIADDSGCIMRERFQSFET